MQTRHTTKEFRWTIAIICFLVLGQLMACGTYLISYYAVVTNVINGNTIVLLRSSSNPSTGTISTNVVTLAGIEVPTLDQAGGEDARNTLVRLALGRNVVVMELRTDKGQFVSIYDNPRLARLSDNVNLKMLQMGMAKWNGRMIPDSVPEPKMAAAERMAREQRIGVWGNENRDSNKVESVEDTITLPPEECPKLTNVLAASSSSSSEKQPIDAISLSPLQLRISPRPSSVGFTIAGCVVVFAFLILFVARVRKKL